METISKVRNTREKLSTSNEEADKCEFENYDALLLMSETAKMRRLITKRGTLEILIPLCCSTNLVRSKIHPLVRTILMMGFETK